MNSYTQYIVIPAAYECFVVFRALYIHIYTQNKQSVNYLNAIRTSIVSL
jgi:hypothetical protein